MQTGNWKKVKELLQEVLPLDDSERARFFDNSGVNIEIRAEVESLLAFEEESEDLMRLSAVEFSKDFFDEDEAAKNVSIGQRFGVYEIVREIGYGGMGVVYLARRSDGKFDQQVALKLLKREMNTSVLRRRFRREREILASLEHPNIARLLDAGTTDDKIPYLVMEYVEGRLIDDYCSRNDLDLTERLELFRKVCAAVDYAHRNLIVHRDLKPSNILITKDGTPKLLDFGISKILSTDEGNAKSLTITRLGALTPNYASPEQLRSESVTTATDIYSLGVILYEILSGHRPFEMHEGNLREIYHAVIESDPPPPSALIDTISESFKIITNAKTEVKSEEVNEEKDNHKSNYSTIVQSFGLQTQPNKFRHTLSPAVKLNSNSLRGDLDNIVLKALKKEPERRYLSAENFSEDIKRHLDGLPVAARPDTFSYRAEKFIKRNNYSVAAGALVLLAIFGGVIATLWQARIAQAERARAEKRFNDVRVLANSFLFEFSPKIENLPGSMPARQLLVTRAQEYLDNLSQESADDLQLQSELAKAYEKVGDVQGNPFNPNTGDVKGAVQSYEKAQAIRRRLLASEPDSLAAQSDLAYNLEKYADIQSKSGDYSQGEVNYDEALVLREKILARQPQDYEARANLARLLKARGIIGYYENQFKKALEFYDRAAAIYEQLHREKPDDALIAEWYAYMFVIRGESLDWDGEYERAGTEIQKGLDMLLPLHVKNPNNPTLARTLMLAYQNRAANYEGFEDYEKSLAAHTKALEIAQNSHKADAQNAQAKRDVAIANKKIGAILDFMGRSQDSVEKFIVSLKLFQELDAIDQNNAGILYDIANTRYGLGDTYLTLKDYDRALECYQTAKEEFRKVLEINPKDIMARTVSAFILQGMAKSYDALAEKRNQPELRNKAVENLRGALEALKKLKADGNLGEYHSAYIPKMETQIEQIEGKVAKR